MRISGTTARFPSALVAGWLLLASLFLWNGSARAALPQKIGVLKDLHRETILVEGGLPGAVIVAPPGDRYETAVREVRERIYELGGVKIPVYRRDAVPAELLRSRNVIALGNMATNPFIEVLYRQWHVILDLTYPGEGGYVVRSLHNPYGTGHNVIFLGGSDDEGVAEAMRAFCGELRGGDSIKVGWLLKVRPGRGWTPPVIGAQMKKWRVFGWNDSWRTLSNGRTVGYEPATYFGWNPVSIAGMLYYMTGDPAYIETFKELALPDPNKAPAMNRSSDAFTNPADPLVKSYHYRAHLLDCVYDLIEESPLFSDKDRLAITNKLLEHQLDCDPDNTYSVPNGDRHALWHMMSIYTGSRYFAASYPDPGWNRRMGNARKGFRSLIGNPTWGERDTLEWVSTSIEPVFDFFLMDGADEFVSSGTARVMIGALEALMTADESDDYNRFLPLNLLHKAAWLLKDGRYVWMARRLGFDLRSSRIGPSYWPSVDLPERPPVDLVRRVAVVPVARSDWETARTPNRLQESFHLLSFRTGLDRTDDYFSIDGFNSQGRHPYQLNTLYRLRMFGGKDILSGYGNDLAITVDGMTGGRVALSAALKQAFVDGDLAYVQTEVPDMPGSRWRRHLLYLKDRLTVVVDGVTALQAGTFDVTAFWQTGSGIVGKGASSRQLTTHNGSALAAADHPMEKLSDLQVRTRTFHELRPGEELTLATLFYLGSRPKTLRSVRSGGYLTGGDSVGFAVAGTIATTDVNASTDFLYLDRDRILLVNGDFFAIRGRHLFTADGKVSMSLDIRRNRMKVSAPWPTRVELTGICHPVALSVPPGETEYPCDALSEDVRPEVERFLLGREKETVVKDTEDVGPTGEISWHAVWERSMPGKVVRVVADGDTGSVWAASQDRENTHLSFLTREGVVKATTRRGGEILSLWAGNGKRPRRFRVIAGFADDTVWAFDETAREVWNFKTHIDSAFFSGDRLEAPWFTDPGPPYNMRGVYSIAVGDFRKDGTEQVAVGRPCTVEFHRLDGSLIRRIPTRWGTNTSLALLENTNVAGRKRMLLAAKANAGIPRLSSVDSLFDTVSDDLFGDLPPRYIDMHAWMQRGTRHLFVEDVDRDGRPEVIYTLSGHWNELRLYDGVTGKPRWVRYLGPDKGGMPFMSAAALIDLDGGGRKDVVVGTKTGWVLAFDAQGRTVLSKHFGAPVTVIAGRPEWGALAVGTADGTVRLVGPDGTIRLQGKLKGVPADIVALPGHLVIGDSLGTVRRYDVPRTATR